MVISTHDRRRKNLALTLFLALPFVLLAGLMWYFAMTINREKPVATAAPVGAGWGATGGANGIGELLQGNTAKALSAEQRPTGPAAAPAAPGLAGVAPTPDAAREPTLVQPESLSQGFTIIVQDKAGRASPSSPIYIAGTFNNWNAGDPSFRLEAQSDMRWRINMPQPEGGEPIQFKFTRGDWDHVEISGDNADIANRSLPKIDVSNLAPGELPKVELSVEKWADQREGAADRRVLDPYRTIEATGTLRRLQVQGGAGTAVGHVRDVLVWLPPGYDAPENATRTYPVLYLHDGQNIFEKLPNVPGEWNADETAAALIKAGEVRPMIIVGVPHSGAGRISEYLPADALPGITAQGSRHVAWLMSDVKPRVERAFRVDTARASTAIGGSSLGAVIALEAFRQHPDAFGMVLAESLPLRTGSEGAWDAWLGSFTTWPDKLFLGMGGKETLSPVEGMGAKENEYVTAVKALNDRLAASGVSEERRRLVIDPEASHNEAAWSARFPAALRYLFGN